MPFRTELLRFLTEGKISLTQDPIEEIRTLFSGGASNPDSAVVICDTLGSQWTIYFENKTWRRGLDVEQIRSHVALYCTSPQSLLLVVTPRPSDGPLARSLSEKILFKTWHEISEHLLLLSSKEDQTHFLLSQFIEYGHRTGEFANMNLTSHELSSYVTVIGSNVHGKLHGLFTHALELDYPALGVNVTGFEVADAWGRYGGDIGLVNTEFGQWMFCGIYKEVSDHQIPLKKPNTPELVFFLDIDPQRRELLRKLPGIESALADLGSKGFEDNLFTRLTPNHWRFLAKRTPLTEFPELTVEMVQTFIRATLTELVACPVIARMLS
jgi:hypothetical protein